MRVIFAFLGFSFGLAFGADLHSAALALILATFGTPFGWNVGARVARRIKGV